MNRQPIVDVFVEDSAHEHLLCAFVRRILNDEGKSAGLRIRSAAGGRGKTLKEFKNYQRAILKGGLPRPTLMVIATDTNCTKLSVRQNEVLDAVDPQFQGIVVVACPDPHVERWYMADLQSFHNVVGKTPKLGRRKCQRDYYKMALANVIRDAGHPPTLGGIEFAEELAQAMDLYHAGKTEPSLHQFLEDLRMAIQNL